MPELPEVEAARRAIEDHCLGKKIKRSVVAGDSKVIDGVLPSDFEASLLGKTVVSAHRKGKNMWLQLDSPPFPSFQFGMTGAIYIKGVAVTKYKRPYVSPRLKKIAIGDYESMILSHRSAVKDTDEWPSKYSKLFIELDDGLELSFTDKRRFAKVRLLENPASVPPISELGPDALLELMTTEELFKSLSKKKIGIKALLLDQSYISGIGNWIADEVMYQARVHPLQIAASISQERCETLHHCIKEVIEKAVEVGADSSQFPSSWIFHSREKKRGTGTAFVDGKKIEFITAGGRTTVYVPELQTLSGGQVAKVPSKSRKGTAEATKDSEGDDVLQSDEEEEETENAKIVKSKRGKGSGGTSFKKPIASKKSRRKGEEIDDDNMDDYEQEEQAKRGRTTRAGIKRKGTGENKKTRPRQKSVESVEEDDGLSTRYDDKEEGDDELGKGMKGKGRNGAKLSNKRIQTTRTGKQPKKRSK